MNLQQDFFFDSRLISSLTELIVNIVLILNRRTYLDDNDLDYGSTNYRRNYRSGALIYFMYMKFSNPIEKKPNFFDILLKKNEITPLRMIVEDLKWSPR